MRAAVTLMVWLVLSMPIQAGAASAKLLGYGARSCDEYVIAWKGRERGEQESVEEYLMYRSWFEGFVSGMSFATGEDMLRGVAIDSAMNRTRIFCQNNPDADFFNGASDLLKMLSRLPRG